MSRLLAASVIFFLLLSTNALNKFKNVALSPTVTQSNRQIFHDETEQFSV